MMKFKLSKIINNITDKISKNNKYSFRFIKLIVFTFENYKKSRSGLWSSALTFYSILTIVPLLAIFFVIIQGFGIEKIFNNSMLSKFFLKQEILDQVLVFSKRALANNNGGVLAGIGILILMWSVIKIFSAIEKSFNEIWKVTESRTLVRKLTDYISLIVLFPITIILSNGFTIFLKYFLLKIDYKLLVILNFIPNILFVIFFVLIYLIIPNTKVKLSTAIISGLFASILLQISQYIFMHLQISLLNYNAIYGSFSLILIFILWQKIFWHVILLGSHLSFVIQNSYKYSYTINEIKLNFTSKRDISLLYLYYFIKNYNQDEKPLSTNEIAHKLDISIEVSQEIINSLENLYFLVEIVTDDDDRKYKLSKNIEVISIGYVISKLSEVGYQQKIGEEPMKILEKINSARENFEYNKLLKDI